jgi:hypothetical protein
VAAQALENGKAFWCRHGARAEPALMGVSGHAQRPASSLRGLHSAPTAQSTRAVYYLDGNVFAAGVVKLHPY